MFLSFSPQSILMNWLDWDCPS
jgi:hypothetical protein